MASRAGKHVTFCRLWPVPLHPGLAPPAQESGRIKAPNLADTQRDEAFRLLGVHGCAAGLGFGYVKFKVGCPALQALQALARTLYIHIKASDF